MKRIFFSLALGILLSSAASAQAAPAKQKQGTDKYQKVSGLTTDQQQQLQKIKTDAKIKRDAIQNNTALSKADKNKQIQELNEQEHQQRLAVLTPDQQQQFKQTHKMKAAKPAAKPAAAPAGK
ncbi:MAG: hypothetical protein J7539_15855 [Niabella sp.]|nr:hypothetical protein [Niabella sp.]MBO9620498.1 hypothetical protein [Niabella sp.]